MNFSTFLENLTALYGENLLWYVSFAFPFFIVFWIIGKNYFKKIRIQHHQTANSWHFKHDLGFSASTFLIFAIMDIGLLFLEHKGYTYIYLDITDYSYWWLPVSFCIVLFIDDMFFYWSHRAMHHPRLYKFFHQVHHESTDPSPLTAFAFHPSEAVVENLMHFVLPFLLPLHIGVIIAWQVFSMLNNVLGHLGYEVYPKGWVKLPLLRYKTASTHHNMHHQLFNGNYALYFTWWDKWMGTEFKDYEIKHEQIFERKNFTEELVNKSEKPKSEFYLSDPQIMMDKQLDNLNSLAIKKEKIPRESFSIRPQNKENTSPKSQISAQVFGKSYQFETQEGKTILASALQQGIPLPHSCQRGLCGMCKMKCIDGKVSMLNNQALTEQDLQAGYILTCQALAQSQKISIKNS